MVTSALVSNVVAVVMIIVTIVICRCSKNVDNKDVGIMSLILIESYFFMVLLQLSLIGSLV